MLENFLRDRAVIERLRGGLFGPHLDSFVATLAKSGYAGATVQERLRLLNDFERWLGRKSLALADLQRSRRQPLPGGTTSRRTPRTW